jgi:hypothetical protein
MSESSHSVEAIARKNLSKILRAMDRVGLDRIGAAIGKDGSTVCKMKTDGRVEDIAMILAVVGIVVVDKDAICVSRDEFLALKTFAERGIHELMTELIGNDND